ncbi:28S ribosomal protein S31 mitochondrial [Taenia crassiceps]|uniref:Small ribosomal subunit protein mS31 n=1 Tax=Taenia crassiceps TaxID=6207 RepID=A0ABR4QEB3_9CEST
MTFVYCQRKIACVCSSAGLVVRLNLLSVHRSGMLLNFLRHPYQSRPQAFSIIRLYSSEGKSSRSTRRKGKGPAREQNRLQPTPKIAPSTSQLLEDFLAAESKKTDGRRESRDSSITQPSEGRESVLGMRSTDHPIQAQGRDAIKFTPPLDPYSDQFGFATPNPATDGAYNNEVFKEIEALEASAYRAKSTYNKFEELIQWTLEGKLWRYPIDNEQDWREELDTPFHEHVFLNQFEKKQAGGKKPAPLKAFMELVFAGLGQNPYLSVKEKRDHIVWFEGYFADKMGDIESAVEEERRIAQAEPGTRETKPAFACEIHWGCGIAHCTAAYCLHKRLLASRRRNKHRQKSTKNAFRSASVRIHNEPPVKLVTIKVLVFLRRGGKTLVIPPILDRQNCRPMGAVETDE